MPSFPLVRWLRHRPLHFVLAGFLGWWLFAPSLQEVEVREPVVLDAARIAALKEGWVAAMGRAPDAAEMRALEQREIDDEILFREAIAHALHRIDPVVRQRLLLNMRFLDPGTEVAEERLFQQALELGMHRNDLVVRRRLVQIMELSLQEGSDRSAPDAAELARMYEQRRAEFALPARWRLRHVYFSADRRGERAADDARATLRLLSGQDPDALPESARGDPFLGGLSLPLLDERQLAGQFGSAFARAVADCEPRRWCGPLRSSYGEHLVLVEESVPERVPGVDDPEVRRRLESDVLRERASATLARAMVELRRRYGVPS